MNKQHYLDFENYVCKKRGNVSKLDTVWDNREMILFIVQEALGLSEDEYASIYSTTNNQMFQIQKYITSMTDILKEQDKMDVFFCEKSKEQVLAILYPHREINKKTDMVHKLNSNDEFVIRYLMRIKNSKKRDIVMRYYLSWLLKNVFQLKSKGEVYDFLLKGDQLRLQDYVPALKVIYQDYCCLLDFYFLTLPNKEAMEQDLPCYLKRRVKISDHLDVFKKTGILTKTKPKKWPRFRT